MTEEHNIPKVYDPASVEKKWYEFWEKNRYFHAEAEPGKKPFSIVIPPPNITGKLHMGHALDNTLQDILIRWHRMMLAGYFNPLAPHDGRQHPVDAGLRPCRPCYAD